MKTIFSTLGFRKSIVALALGTAFSLGAVSSVSASPNVAPAKLKNNAAPVYVVRKGDTLWDISGKFLKQPWRWKEIWAGNRYIKNPNLIYPGDRLLLCSVNGRPLVGKDEGDGCAGIIRRHSQTQVAEPQVRVESSTNSIPLIPLSDIESWLYRADIVSPDSITNTPYVVGAPDGRLIVGDGQTLYARGNGMEVGQKYGVYHTTEPYFTVDEKGKKHIAGVEVLEVASGVATEMNGDIATIEVSKSYNQEINRGDLILPEYESGLPSLFFPADEHSVREGGQIVRVLGSIGDAAKRSVITINRGTTDGAEIGQVFNVYQQGNVVKDTRSNQMIHLPDNKVGNVMIFKTFDQFSYAYVLESALPMKVGSFVRAPRDSD